MDKMYLNLCIWSYWLNRPAAGGSVSGRLGRRSARPAVGSASGWLGRRNLYGFSFLDKFSFDSQIRKIRNIYRIMISKLLFTYVLCFSITTFITKWKIENLPHKQISSLLTTYPRQLGNMFWAFQSIDSLILYRSVSVSSVYDR